MSDYTLTAHIEKKKFEYVGICNPTPCSTSITSSDIYATTDVSKAATVDGVMLTAPMCESDNTDCTSANVVAYLLPSGKEPIDCLFCTEACGEIETQADTAVSITQLPDSFADANCISECIKQIKWAQDYYTSESQKWDATKQEYTKTQTKNALNTITMRVTIPSICGLYGLKIQGEISKCTASVNYQGIIGAIPTDSSSFWVHGGEWAIAFDYNDNSDCFFPGEYLTIYGYMWESESSCNPLLIGYGYYETKCLTSAQIRGCGLAKDETKTVTGEQVWVREGVYALLANEHIKDVVVKDYDGKTIVAHKSKSITETLTILSSQFLKYKDISNVKVTKGGTEITSGYSVDTTNGIFTVASDSTLWKYSHITITYDALTRNYDLDTSAGKIRIHTDAPDIVNAQYVYVNYSYTKSTVEAGGDNYEFQNEWKGNDKLHWYVTFKGKKCWVKCPDFVKWNIGDRVLIHKGGASKTKKGTAETYITSHKCRNVDSTNQTPQEDLLSDGAVAYTLDRGSDIIVQIKVTL